jgi:hypothetical protein
MTWELSGCLLLISVQQARSGADTATAVSLGVCSVSPCTDVGQRGRWRCLACFASALRPLASMLGNLQLSPFYSEGCVKLRKSQRHSTPATLHHRCFMA